MAEWLVLLTWDHKVQNSSQDSLRKQAYSNILKILRPKNKNVQIQILIFFIFLLKT